MIKKEEWFKVKYNGSFKELQRWSKWIKPINDYDDSPPKDIKKCSIEFYKCYDFNMSF